MDGPEEFLASWTEPTITFTCWFVL